jgi:hypothetical protein
MKKVVKVGALLVVSAGIIYSAFIMYEDYVKTHKRPQEVQPLFSGGTMGNIGCVVPPCF